MAVHPVAFALVGAAVLLLLSALVGALDLFAVGAVLGFWTLIAATGLVLGRPGVDWEVPVDQLRQGLRHALTVARQEAAKGVRRRPTAGRMRRKAPDETAEPGPVEQPGT
ncbi:hypothetical protein UG55_102135 [Frankia sp. EI5c]|uniref:hypothetical protein n=1 Tax=Frankia sp. EI5c TaxID=683316 RepID=UPI0007C2184E|nr:hypothetical protein [Frankia sp. EI5c]OAA25601.1 hypothetical protein UG55_102135 [Frankia sp. EI5c]